MGSQGIVAVAFVGKKDEPLFFYTDEDYSEAMRLQMIIYGSLDIVEEKRRKPISTAPNADLSYLGHLYAVDDYKVYGHYSNTHIKTIVVCDHVVLEAVAKSAIFELIGHYVTIMQNPFQPIGMPIVSKKLTELVQKVILKNQVQQTSSHLPKKP